MRLNTMKKEKLEFDISHIRYMSKEEIIHKLEEVLPIDDIRLLSMLYIERQSYKEIAKELKISKIQIDNRIRRAKRIINKSFKKSDFQY